MFDGKHTTPEASQAAMSKVADSLEYGVNQQSVEKQRKFDQLKLHRSQDMISRMKPIKLRKEVAQGGQDVEQEVPFHRWRQNSQPSSMLVRSSTKVVPTPEPVANRAVNVRSKSGIPVSGARPPISPEKGNPPMRKATGPKSIVAPVKFQASAIQAREGGRTFHDESAQNYTKPLIRDSSVPEQSMELIRFLGSNRTVSREADKPIFSAKNHPLRSGSRSPQVECENEQTVMREFSATGIGLSYIPPNIFRVKGLRVSSSNNIGN